MNDQEQRLLWRIDYWRDRAVKAETHASDLRRELVRVEKELKGLQAYIGKQVEAWSSLKG